MNVRAPSRLIGGLLLATAAAVVSPVFEHSGVRSQESVTASISDIDDSGEVVRAVLTVDQGGRPATGLSIDGVTAADTGRAVSVTSFEPVIDEAIPLALVLVIDTSGSMTAQLNEVQTAALDLVAQLGPSDEASVIAFASEVATPLPLTLDPAVLRTAINELEAAGDTALYDAVVAAADLARASGFQRRAIVLLTDGEDFGGVSTARRAASLESAAGAAAFYTIGVGSSVDGDYLGELATGTGGRFFLASSGTEIVEVYATIEELLRSQYVLEFDRGDAVAGEQRSLQVTVDVGGLVVVAKRDYVSAGPVATTPPRVESNVAAPAPSTTPAAQSAAPVAESAPPTEGDARGGASLGTAGLLLLVAALLAAAGVLLLRRSSRSGRRSVPATVAPPRLDARPVVRSAARRPELLSGRLSLEAPSEPRVVEVSSAPVTIGTADTSQLPLDPSPSAAPAHARVWRRDGRVMVHHIAPGHETCVNGRSIEWAVLGDGDELQIGPYRIIYRVGGPQPAMASSGDSR